MPTTDGGYITGPAGGPTFVLGARRESGNFSTCYVTIQGWHFWSLKSIFWFLLSSALKVDLLESKFDDDLLVHSPCKGSHQCAA
jgi:hypothetical protein